MASPASLVGKIINFPRMLPRRLQVFSALILTSIFLMVLVARSSPGGTIDNAYQKVDKITDKITGNIPIPSIPKPFQPAAHKPPPEQSNSTAGDSKWYSDWKWRNPFSSSITLDENRAVLPPLRKRAPVYTYYDSTTKKDDKVKEAEHALLFAWRRAWWAQGFQPVVLGPAEAMHNPLYETVQRLALNKDLESDFARWLAWGNMGTGVLANWLAYPMAPYHDDLLSFLRHGEFPKLTGFEGLKSSLLAGDKTSINAALKQVLANGPVKNTTTSVIEALPQGYLTLDKNHDGVAVYDLTTIQKQYKTVSVALENSRADGLNMLAVLINAHLHNTWQGLFKDGIAVLRPMPEHMSALVEEAIDIARNLTQCPETPMPASCPPNRPKCAKCHSSQPLRISQPPVFRNNSRLFTIGTVPHPYTFASLTHQREQIDIRFIRREMKRDQWIRETTRELLGTGRSAQSRLVNFKEAVGSEWGMAHCLWLTAERETHKDLNWLVGFAIPTKASDRGESEPPVPGPERRPPPPKSEGPQVSEQQLAHERELLQKAREALKTKGRQAKPLVSVIEGIEAWNLADTEAWRFARAFSARRRVERLKWEEEESKFAGAEGRGSSWGRWWD